MDVCRRGHGWERATRIPWLYREWLQIPCFVTKEFCIRGICWFVWWGPRLLCPRNSFFVLWRPIGLGEFRVSLFCGPLTSEPGCLQWACMTSVYMNLCKTSPKMIEELRSVKNPLGGEFLVLLWCCFQNYFCFPVFLGKKLNEIDTHSATWFTLCCLCPLGRHLVPMRAVRPSNAGCASGRPIRPWRSEARGKRGGSPFFLMLVSLVIMDGNPVTRNSTAPQLRCWASRGCGSKMRAHATWLQGTWPFPYMGCKTRNACLLFPGWFQTSYGWYFCWLGLPALRKTPTCI